MHCRMSQDLWHSLAALSQTEVRGDGADIWRVLLRLIEQQLAGPLCPRPPLGEDAGDTRLATTTAALLVGIQRDCGREEGLREGGDELRVVERGRDEVSVGDCVKFIRGDNWLPSLTSQICMPDHRHGVRSGSRTRPMSCHQANFPLGMGSI